MKFAIGMVVVALAACGSKTPHGDLTVVGTPKDAIEAKGKIQLAFSKPMAKPEQIDKVLANAGVTVSPALPGDWKWLDAKDLVLSPKSNLPISTKYTITVASGTTALDGSELAEDYSFSFATERLTGDIDLIGSPDRAAKDQLVKLTFSQEVAFDQIAAACSFTGGPATVKVKVAPNSNPGPTKLFTIVPDAPLAANTAYKLACSESLHGTVGNVGLEKAIETSFHTFGPLTFASLDPNRKDIIPDENLALKIAFSNPIAEPYQMSLEPKVVGFPERCHALGVDKLVGVTCAVQLEARTPYTLKIDAKQKDIFGQTIDKPEVIEFATTDAQPTISMESGYFVAELTRPVIPLWTRNVTKLDIRAVEITQANFHQIRPMLDWWEQKPVDLKGAKLVAKTSKLPIAGTKNMWGQHSLGATELVGGTPGPGMYYVEVGASEVPRAPYENGGVQKILVNFTDIGLVSKVSGSKSLVWATRLSTGKPLPGATITVRDGGGKVTFTGTTDASGVAVLPGTGVLGGVAKSADPEAANEHYAEEREGSLSDARIFASLGNDWTMVAPTRSGGLASWNFNVSSDYDHSAQKLRGFMHTDRGLYSPGDKVHVKGLARVTKLGESMSLPAEGTKVKVSVNGPQGKTFTTAEAKLSSYGGFWFDLDLPADARLGDYYMTATLPFGSFSREFSVEEFRPATFELTGKAKETEIVRRGDFHAEIAANYLYGAPLRTGEVQVAVHSRRRSVDFKTLPGFDFEQASSSGYGGYYGDYESGYSQQMVTEDHTTLDDKGNASVAVAITPNDVTSDADLIVEATVTAPNNETITKSFTIPYFHAKKYYGVKLEHWFSEIGKPTTIQVVAADTTGKIIDGPAKVTITRRDWNCVWEDWGYRGSYQCKDKTETLLDKTVTIAGKPTDVQFTPTTGGDYWVQVAPVDDKDKDETQSGGAEIYAWGDGGGSWESNDSLKFDIVADKKVYKAGDTATLILKTDLANATGLVTIERGGVIEQRLVDITPKMKQISVPLTAAYAPNIYVSVALVQGRTGPGVRGKPRMRMGIANLSVQPEDNKLAVTIETDKPDYRPGEQVTATVKVLDAAGKPIAAEVSITAADEGVLSLIAYETPNPIPTFYASWGLGVDSATQIEYIRDVPGPNQERPATGGDAPGTMRQKFISTPVWAPGAITDANGLAKVTFKAPDNLTAFRMMAVAADKATRFGSGEKRFTVSKPLQLHELMPHFANVGDTMQAGVVIHNETGAAGTAKVKIVPNDRFKVTGDLEKTVALAKNTNVPVTWDIAATSAGDGALAFSVTMGNDSDAVEFKLPVMHPSPERDLDVADGAVTDSKTVALTMPEHAIDGTVQLVVSVDPDGLSGMEDSVRELVGYPYGCLEQTTSKLIPMIAARDLAEALAIDGLTGPKLDGYVNAGIAKIGRHQTTYGGFSLWPGGEPDAYYTAYALWGLSQAKLAGYKIDQQRVDDAIEYLKGDGAQPNDQRPHYHETGYNGSQAFALYVRSVLGDKSAQAAAATLATKGELPIYGKAFLARAMAVALTAKDPAVQKLVGEVTAAAAAAAKTPNGLLVEPDEKSLYAYMSSSKRTTAIALVALVELDPKNVQIKPLATALIKARKSTTDYWDTQSNIWNLIALQSYAKWLNGQTPTATITIGEDPPAFTGALAGKQRMKVITVPFPTAKPSVTIASKGSTNYRVSLRYRKTVDTLVAEAHGTTINLAYLDADGKPKTSWMVGDVATVKVSTDWSYDSDNTIVSVAIPAGFEVLNTKFATVAANPSHDEWEEWGTYREIHADHVNFASEYSWSGNYSHEFQIRAIASGKFAKPPSKTEYMYDPKTFAQTAYETIEIKAKP